MLIVADIIIYLVLTLILGAIICIATPSSSKLNMSAIFSSGNKYWLVQLILIVAADIYFLVLIGKQKMFGFSKTLNASDRAKSNLYGQADFMTAKELSLFAGATTKKEKFDKKTQSLKVEYKKNGMDINFKTLPQEHIEGYVIKSVKEKGTLSINMVPKLNCLVLGTAGTGKSLYFLGPTIQANARSYNKPSMLINDLKGELYEAHSKLLKEQGYNVICINLRTPRNSTRINILDDIWYNYHKYLETNDGYFLDLTSQYIIEMSEILSPPMEGQNKEFGDGAIGILAGLIWGMLEDSAEEKYHFTKDMFTISQISNILNKQSDYMMDFITHRDTEKSRVFQNASMIINNASERTVSSYISTLQTNLRKFLDPGIEYLTQKSDFDLNEITTKPTAIFLIIPDESNTRYVLAAAIIVQIYNKLIATASKQQSLSLDRSWYFFLDEFGQMPKIAKFPNWIAVCRSRNIFLCPVVQANSQLKAVFGENEAITIQDQCHIKVFLGSNDTSTLEYFQKQLGTYTVYSRSASINDKSMMHMEYEGSTSLTKKDLVTLDELQYIKPGNIYITLRGQKPIKSLLTPIFDSDCQKQKIFVLGSVKENIQEKKEQYKYYNLNQREEAFLAGDDTTGLDFTWNLKGFENVTENFVDTKTINEIDNDMLIQLGILK